MHPLALAYPFMHPSVCTLSHTTPHTRHTLTYHPSHCHTLTYHPHTVTLTYHPHTVTLTYHPHTHTLTYHSSHTITLIYHPSHTVTLSHTTPHTSSHSHIPLLTHHHTHIPLLTHHHSHTPSHIPLLTPSLISAMLDILDWMFWDVHFIHVITLTPSHPHTFTSSLTRSKSLTDAELEQELGITNTLHRMKLRLALQEVLSITTNTKLHRTVHASIVSINWR